MIKRNYVYEYDVKMGADNEIKFQNFLEKKENIKLDKDIDRYAEIDYRYDKRLIELKSRGICHNQFDTTIVGYNKILKAEASDDFTTEFYFLFTDGLYKWIYNDDEISCVMPCCRKDRGVIEVKDHAYIPIKYLRFISNEILSID